MKATKTELIRLAGLVQKDIASGRVSKNTERSLEVLGAYQNSAIELLQLALEEAAKEQSDKPLVDSLGFLFSHALETLRFDIESGYRTASDLAESVRKRLLTASKTGASDPSTLLFLVQCFGTAKLDLGEGLRGVVEHLLEAVAETHAGDFNATDTADLFGFVADLVKQADGDPFALHAVLNGVDKKVRVSLCDGAASVWKTRLLKTCAACRRRHAGRYDTDRVHRRCARIGLFVVAAELASGASLQPKGPEFASDARKRC